MSVTWDYDGASTLQATLSGTNGSFTYFLTAADATSTPVHQFGTGGSLVLTLTGIGGLSAGDEFYAFVNCDGEQSVRDSNVFVYGTPSTTGAGYPATWSYDGTTAVTVSFTATTAATYKLRAHYYAGGGILQNSHTFSGGPGTVGTTLTLSFTPASGKTFVVDVETSPGVFAVASRDFVGGTADSGTAGSPSTGGTDTGVAAVDPFADDTSAAFAGPVRVGVAFNDPALEPAPTWTFLTDSSSRVAAYTIDRGRQFEFDKTDAGTATISINDVDGTLDPTNSAGPYFGLLEPLLQVRIELWNPVALEYRIRFRGWIEDYDYTVEGFTHQDGSGDTVGLTRLQINCVDIFEILTAIEMQPDGTFGDDPTTATYADATGNIFFAVTDGQGRIDQVMGNSGIPVDYYVAFTLNVDVSEAVYSPSQNVLQVVQDVADAEFPTVANVYTDRSGRLAIHGRLAKFDPAGTAAGAAAGAWDFTEWKAGDGKAVAASPGDTAHIRTFAYNRGLEMIRNSALCTPNHIDDPQTTPGTSDIPGQYVKDATSIGQFGFRSWSAENLFVEDGILTGNTKLQECLAFATFVINNYKEARNRISDIAFRSIQPTATGAAANWDMLCRADISDLVDVTISGPGDTSLAYIFNAEPFFIEGIHEDVKPANGDYADVTMTLDLSPQAYFTDGTGVTS